jgi:hypothetical protein
MNKLVNPWSVAAVVGFAGYASTSGGAQGVKSFRTLGLVLGVLGTAGWLITLGQKS